MSEYTVIGEWAGSLPVQLALRATVVLAGAVLAALLLRRRPAAERHLVWVVALAGVLLLPVLTAVAPAWRVAVPAGVLPASFVAGEPVPVAAGHPAVSILAMAPADAEASTTTTTPAASPTTTTPAAGTTTRAAVTATPAATPGPAGLPAAAILFVLWLAGALVVSAGTLWGMLHVSYVARRAGPLRDAGLAHRARRLAAESGIRRPVRLLEGSATTMPMTFGVRRPTLLLPSTAADWSVARQEAVLRHELAHIQRRDALGQFVADVACALYWFHPLVWLAAARMRLEREHACDDVVLMAGASASDYAAELLAIARSTRVGPVAARAAIAMARPSRLRTRLTAVLEQRARSQRVALNRLIPAAVLAAATIVAVATLTPQPATAAPAADAEIDAGRAAAPASHAAGSDAGPASHATGSDAGSATHGARADAAPSPTAFPSPGLQPADCWTSGFRGSGTMTTRDGTGTRYRQIQRSADGMELCLRTSVASGSAEDDLRPEQLPVGGRMLLATRTAEGSQSMEIVRGAAGLEHTWYINGAERPYDATAQEWRDALLAVLTGYGQVAAIRGEVATLRGQMATVRGREATLRGQIATARGQEATLRGQIASERGRESSLRGEISSIRGRESAMRGRIAAIRGEHSSLRGQISSARSRVLSLESAQRATRDAETRTRLARELEDARAAVAEAERRAAAADVDARVAEVERQIAEYDAEARVRVVEERIQELRSGARQNEIEARIADLRTEERVADIQRRIAELDVPGELRALEARIEAVDAERRAREIEAGLEPQLDRLRQVIRRIR